MRYRAWHRKQSAWHYLDLQDIVRGEATKDSLWYESWCRSTGLKDKNREEIYEGDLIRVNDRYKHGNKEENLEAIEVEFNDYGGFSPFTDLYDYDGMTFLDCFSDYEVIGNIYENPDLINKGDK